MKKHIIIFAFLVLPASLFSMQQMPLLSRVLHGVVPAVHSFQSQDIIQQQFLQKRFCNTQYDKTKQKQPLFSSMDYSETKDVIENRQNLQQKTKKYIESAKSLSQKVNTATWLTRGSLLAALTMGESKIIVATALANMGCSFANLIVRSVVMDIKEEFIDSYRDGEKLSTATMQSLVYKSEDDIGFLLRAIRDSKGSLSSKEAEALFKRCKAGSKERSDYMWLINNNQRMQSDDMDKIFKKK